MDKQDEQEVEEMEKKKKIDKTGVVTQKLKRAENA